MQSAPSSSRTAHSHVGHNGSIRIPSHCAVHCHIRSEDAIGELEHRRSVLAETANRRALLLRRIPLIAAELYQQGLYPSVEKILERLGERSLHDWKTICVAVREAHQALGIRG